MNSSTTGLLLGGGAMLLVGASIAVAPALGDYPVLAGQAWRYAGAALILGSVARLRGRTPPRATPADGLRLLALAAVGLVGFNVLLLAATRTTAPALVASVVGAAPLALALVDGIQSARRPRPSLVMGAALVALGVVVAQLPALQQGASSSILGLVLALATMGCEVGFTVLAAPLLARLGPGGVAT